MRPNYRDLLLRLRHLRKPSPTRPNHAHIMRARRRGTYPHIERVHFTTQIQLLLIRQIQPAWPMLLLAGTLGVSAWVLFFQYTSNTERMHSSIVQRIMTILRGDPSVREVLGDAIRFEPTWWLNGDPWVSGSVRGSLAKLDC